MRERLAAAFIALAVAVLLLAGALRLVALQNMFREEAEANLAEQAQLASQVVGERIARGRSFTGRAAERIVDTAGRLEFVPTSGMEVLADGVDYAGEGEDDLRASVESQDGVLTLHAPLEGSVAFVARDVSSVLVLGALVALLAGLAGWWLAVRLSSPFQKLAGAAEALGRGRFDLVLPETRIPEARAIAQALRVSAAQLETRLTREREFAEHASHVLRTPLTGLRLELEDLTLRDDVPDDVKEAARRCIDRVIAVSDSAGELVTLSRSSTLVEGAETSLEDLAQQVAQQWTDQLAGRRPVSAAVEGELAMNFTPGPMEQLLDLVLTDVKRGRGPVRLVFLGEERHVRVSLHDGTVPLGPGLRTGVDAATILADSQGGRLEADAAGGAVQILLPRR